MFTRFELGRAGGTWCAAGGCRLPSRVLDVSRHPGMLARRSTVSHMSRRGCPRFRARGPTTRHTRSLGVGGRRPDRAAARIVPRLPPGFASGEHFNHQSQAQRTVSIMMCVMLYLGQNTSLLHKLPRTGYQGSQGATLEPTFPQVIPGCCCSLEKSAHRNLTCLRSLTEEQLRHIAVHR